MSSVLWRISLSCFLLTAGCQAILGIEDLGGQPDGGTPPADAGPGDGAPAEDAGAPAFSFAVVTVNATIPLDGTNVVGVEVQRRGGFDGDITVMGMSPPTGLEVEPRTIPAGQTAAEIAVSARAPLALGDTLSFTLVATASALPARMASVDDAEVTGKPGTLDTSFGAGATGQATVSFGSDDYGAFFDLDVAGNGDVLALGWGTGGLGANRFALSRLGAGGTPDPTFNAGAMVRTDFESGSSGENAQGYAVGRQVDGRIIAIGRHAAGTALPPAIALARYSAAGVVDGPAFGNYQSGKSRIDLGGDEQVTGGLILPDSKIVIVGERDNQLFIARATATGQLDTTFHAPAGFDVPNLGTQSRAEAVIVDDRGRLLVAGAVGNIDQGVDNRDMLVLRYDPEGVLDATFGDGGVVRLGRPDIDEHAVGIAVRPTGRIVVAGTGNPGGNGDFQLRQLLETGAPDLSFGDQGVSTPPISAGNDVAEDMLLLPDGRVVIVGNTTQAGPVMARYTRAGTLDVYFGQGGILAPYLGENSELRAVVHYAKAKILLAGGDAGGTPGPGTNGIVLRMWM